MQQVQLVQQLMTCRPRTLTWPDIGGSGSAANKRMLGKPQYDWASCGWGTRLVVWNMFTVYAKTWCSSGVLSGNPNQNMLGSDPQMKGLVLPLHTSAVHVSSVWDRVWLCVFPTCARTVMPWCPHVTVHMRMNQILLPKSKCCFTLFIIVKIIVVVLCCLVLFILSHDHFAQNKHVHTNNPWYGSATTHAEASSKIGSQFFTNTKQMQTMTWWYVMRVKCSKSKVMNATWTLQKEMTNWETIWVQYFWRFPASQGCIFFWKEHATFFEAKLSQHSGSTNGQCLVVKSAPKGSRWISKTIICGSGSVGRNTCAKTHNTNVGR